MPFFVTEKYSDPKILRACQEMVKPSVYIMIFWVNLIFVFIFLLAFGFDTWLHIYVQTCNFLINKRGIFFKNLDIDVVEGFEWVLFSALRPGS